MRKFNIRDKVKVTKGDLTGSSGIVEDLYYNDFENVTQYIVRINGKRNLMYAESLEREEE